MQYLRLIFLIVLCSANCYSQSTNTNWIDSLNGLWTSVRVENFIDGKRLSVFGNVSDLFVSDSTTTFLEYPCGGFDWHSKSTWTDDSLLIANKGFVSLVRYEISFSNDTLILTRLISLDNHSTEKSYFVRREYDAEIITDLLTLGFNPICYDSTNWTLLSYMDLDDKQVFIDEKTETGMPRVIEFGDQLNNGYYISDGNIVFNKESIYLINAVSWWGEYPDGLKGMMHISLINNSNIDRIYQYVRK